MAAKAEGRCARCQKFWMGVLEHAGSHHSDDLENMGNGSRWSKKHCDVHCCNLRCSDAVHGEQHHSENNAKLAIS